MRRLHRTLIRSEQPTFEQRSHAVNSRKRIVANRFLLPSDGMPVADFRQSRVTAKTVGVDGAARLHHHLHGTGQALACEIRDTQQSYPTYSSPILLRRNNDERLAFGSPGETRFERWLPKKVAS